MVQILNNESSSLDPGFVVVAFLPAFQILCTIAIPVLYSGSLFGFLILVPYSGSLFGFLIRVPYSGSLFWFLIEFLTYSNLKNQLENLI